VTLASYSSGRINVFRPVLKPCNESQLVLRPKHKLFQTRGAATEKRRLLNIVLEWGRINRSVLVLVLGVGMGACQRIHWWAYSDPPSPIAGGQILPRTPPLLSVLWALNLRPGGPCNWGPLTCCWTRAPQSLAVPLHIVTNLLNFASPNFLTYLSVISGNQQRDDF